jgi:hypothetical protein
MNCRENLPAKMLKRIELQERNSCKDVEKN